MARRSYSPEQIIKKPCLIANLVYDTIKDIRRSRETRQEAKTSPYRTYRTQTQFAEKINGKRKSIYGYETGATLLSIRTLIEIAKILKKPASYFSDE